MLSIGEVAKQTGLSVRSLRHWEKQGIISCTRSDAEQRYFSAAQIIRLQHAVTLKRMGFSLAAIADMLHRDRLNARQILSLQRDVLAAERQRLDTAVTALDRALGSIGSVDDLAPATLCMLIKLGEIDMNTSEWQTVYDKYYTPEEQEKWAAAKAAIPDGVVQQMERDWPPLIARIEGLLNSDPASAEAQACVAEWNRLMQPIYDHDPGLADGASRMYDDMENWGDGAPQAPFSKAVWDFIQKAAAASA